MKKLLGLFLIFTSLSFAQITLVTTEVAGLTFKLPSNWHIQADDYSIIVSEDPNNPDAAILGLFAFISQNGSSATSTQIADSMLESFDLASQGIYAELMDENIQQAALYRLYQLYDFEDVGYLSTYTYVDEQTKGIYYLFYSALQDSFVTYGGPALPLVAFVGMDENLLNYTDTSSSSSSDLGAISESCENQASGTSQQDVTLLYQQCMKDKQTSFEIMSQISAMSHETMMKTIYNLDTGWCYSGETGCY